MSSKSRIWIDSPHCSPVFLSISVHSFFCLTVSFPQWVDCEPERSEYKRARRRHHDDQCHPLYRPSRHGGCLAEEGEYIEICSHAGANSQVVTQIRVEFHDKVSVMLSLHGLISRIFRVAPSPREIPWSTSSSKWDKTEPCTVSLHVFACTSESWFWVSSLRNLISWARRFWDFCFPKSFCLEKLS